MVELYSKFVVVIVFHQGQSTRGVLGEDPRIPGGDPREDFNMTNHGAGLGGILQEMPATSVEGMIALREMIMENVLRLGNSASNAEAKTILREQLRARGGTGEKSRGAFDVTNHEVERRIVVVWLRGIQTFPYNETTPVE